MKHILKPILAIIVFIMGVVALSTVHLLNALWSFEVNPEIEWEDYYMRKQKVRFNIIYKDFYNLVIKYFK
jgi:phosphate starvation-inducible membrane PsiE